MISPDTFFLLHQQHHQEMVRQAEQALLVRASRRTLGFSQRVFLHLLWWVGSALLSWGCALRLARRAAHAAEKGCCVCLP